MEKWVFRLKAQRLKDTAKVTLLIASIKSYVWYRFLSSMTCNVSEFRRFLWRTIVKFVYLFIYLL